MRASSTNTSYALFSVRPVTLIVYCSHNPSRSICTYNVASVCCKRVCAWGTGGLIQTELDICARLLMFAMKFAAGVIKIAKPCWRTSRNAFQHRVSTLHSPQSTRKPKWDVLEDSHCCTTPVVVGECWALKDSSPLFLLHGRWQCHVGQNHHARLAQVMNLRELPCPQLLSSGMHPTQTDLAMP